MTPAAAEAQQGTLSFSARLDAAIAAGAVGVVSLDETQRVSFERDCPQVESGCESCGVDFVQASRATRWLGGRLRSKRLKSACCATPTRWC